MLCGYNVLEKGKVIRLKMDLKVFGYLALITQVGLNMAIPIFLSIFAGNWLDNKLGTHGLILIVFILMGVYMSFRNLFTIVLKKIDGKKDSKR